MSVHYKFKSALDYDTVTFDGLHICIGDLKAAISRQKRIGKTSDFDLQITNAQTKEVYSDDNTLIPKNTSLLVARIPLAQQPKKQWEGSNNQQQHKDVSFNKGLADLSRMEGSEQDKINAMISQSTFDYDPTNYLKIRGQNQRGVVPIGYTCHRCQKKGHWIKDCPQGNTSEGVDIRRSTGIPRSFMIPVGGPKEPGAMMTPAGTFAVPVVDREAYLASETAGGGDTPTNAPAAPEATIPDELVCSLCRDLLTDAVMIPCCGNSFCDECIRGALLESENHECPDCREKEIAPTTLIPNRFLRNSVSSFRNQTGYSRRMPHRQPVAQPPPPQQQEAPPPAPGAANMPPPAVQPGKSNDGPGTVPAHAQNPDDDDSDGSADDNITVTMPPPGAFNRVPTVRPVMPHGVRQPMQRPMMRYGPLPGMKPMDMPQMQRLDEQRPSTPTIDERREFMVPQAPFRGPMPFMARGPPPPGQFNPGFNHGLPPPGVAPPGVGPGPARAPPPFPDPHQPSPPGIKDSPTNGSDVDPLEAFNRMIREKEMRARRREVERRRSPSLPRRSPHSPRSPASRGSRSPTRLRGSRSPPPRVRGSRSPRPVMRPSRSPPPRMRPSSRSPGPRMRPSRSPPPRMRPSSRSPVPRMRPSHSPVPRMRPSRSPVARMRQSRSPPPRIRDSRSPPPRIRGRSRGPSRPRYTRSRSISPRGRMRRSPPWSPRRRRSRERSLSLTRSPSPRRRHRSPMRYRSPLRSPPPRSPHRTPLRSPPRSPSGRPISPHRYPGVYDELLSPPRRSVEPPYGARYGPRHNNMPPSGYPPMEPKSMPLMGPMQGPPGGPPGYRDRYEGPHRPPFDNVPPGVEPPVPGFEPSPFEKPMFGPPGVLIERDRLPPPNYREPFRPPFDGPPGTAFREIPAGMPPNDINAHVGQQPRFRENFRPGQFRDQAPVPAFREGQPSFRDGQPGFREGQPPFHNREQMPPQFHRDGPPRDFRGAPPQFRENSFRGHQFRDGAPRDNFREGGPPPGFGPPSADPREPVPPNFHDANFRERFREEHRRDGRPDYRPGGRSNRGGSRYNPELDRPRERDGRDRERYNENRDPADRSERPREDKRPYDKSRERHEERREHDRGREHEKDKEREKDPERHTPEKKRGTPDKKRSRDVREKRISDSRERDVKKEKKEERIRDKSSTEKIKEPKEKEKKEKVKERKKKKKEKEKEKEKDKDKDSEKKRKKDKKEKKDKDKKEEDFEKSETKEIAVEKSYLPEPEPEKPVVVKLEKIKEDKKEKEIAQPALIMKNNLEEVSANPKENLYDDETGETGAIDKEIIQNYVKTQENDAFPVEKSEDDNVPVLKTEVDKEEPFDGIELQANADELDLKPDDGAAISKEMLALLPERSKWEMEDENVEKSLKEPGELSSPEPDADGGKVTTEVLKRAENAIFTKAINSLRPIEIKKISSDRAKLYTDEVQPKGSIQITVPVSENDHRSIEIGKKKRSSKTPPPKLSVKDRLGGKVEDVRKTRDTRVVHSTVELVKARSKTPKKEQPYRKVTVDKSRRADSKNDVSKSERRVISSDSLKTEKHRKHSPSKEHRKKISEKHTRDDIKAQIAQKSEAKDSRIEKEKPASVRKKSTTLDEANFEPDYDENVESEKEEQKDEIPKKREGSPSGLPESKKPKVEPETIKLDLANVKKKPDTESESSTSDSSSSSEDRKKKKKKKKPKKKKKKAASDSDSDSGSSSDDHKKKKKRKHKKKSSKKKKKKDKRK